MTTVFTQTTIVTADAGRTVLHDRALAVDGDVIAAIGPTEELLRAYPQAEVYDGRGKALLPGLINCHAHLTATLNRGITEDCGFPPNLHLPVAAHSLLSAEELTVMALLGALESLKSGTTTLVENAQGIATYADALAQTGLRWVFAESGRDAVCLQAGALVRMRIPFPPTYGRRRCSACTTCLVPGTAPIRA